MAAYDEDDFKHALRELDHAHQVADVAPTLRQKMGGFTVVCLIMNRTIGSGIFVAPAVVLQGTGTVGASLCLWAAGALLAACGLLVWLEFGLSVPWRVPSGRTELASVPRSGGEKNYLEFVFPNPRYLTTCMYGIVFIVLYNLSGNALSFAKYVLIAAGSTDPDLHQGKVIGIAVAALTTAIMVHVFSRRGGILLNNLFAVVKVSLLVAMVVLGVVKGVSSGFGGPAPSDIDNLDPSTAFKQINGDRSSVANFVDAFVYVFYAYSGFEQPFYVLGEVANPRKTFPRYTLIAMLLTAVLFVLVNVAYLMAVPKAYPFNALGTDMATVFFHDIFGTVLAQRVIAALISTSVFGNIVVMTFTASRVKQEIAKEGILPFSLFFATATTTPWAKLKARWQKRRYGDAAGDLHEHLEQTPMAALGLHWLSSVVLLAVTAMLKPSQAYFVLVNLYTYVMMAGMGCAVSGALLYVYLTRYQEWKLRAGFRPLPVPVFALVYFLVCGLVLVVEFVPPTAGSVFSYAHNGHIKWFIVPAVGLSAVVWGSLWWFGLHVAMKQRRRELVVTRVPVIVPDDHHDGEYLQLAEIIEHEWHADDDEPREQMVQRAGWGSVRTASLDDDDDVYP